MSTNLKDGCKTDEPKFFATEMLDKHFAYTYDNGSVSAKTPLSIVPPDAQLHNSVDGKALSILLADESAFTITHTGNTSFG